MSSTWERLSLRARLLVVGLVGVAVALAVGGAALYAALSLLSYRYLDTAAGATAADVAALVRQHRLPDPLPATGSQVVQVVDARDRVVSASVNGDRLTALLLPAEIRRAVDSPVVVSGSRMGLDSPLRVTAVRVGSRTVLAASQPADIVHTRHVLALTLLVVYPALLVVLALIAWRVIGAALRPVESLRSSAERISGSGYDERLPLPASRDEIRALAETLNSMLDRLSAARARQRAFVDDAAHELRSPLTALRTQLDVAEHLGEGSPLTADLRADVDRMTALVQDLLTLARIDAGPASQDVERVDVHALLREVAARYPGRPVHLVPGEPGVAVRARAGDLVRVLTNLVDNAVRHARSRVDLSAEETASSVAVAVSDDGPGIAPADRERVFERFTRLDGSRARDAGGTGLGLAIVRELVARNGGTVQVVDSPAGGACVRVELPPAGKASPHARE